MKRYITILLFISFGLTQNTTIAVFDLENNGLEPYEVRQLSIRLESELVKVGKYIVVERNKIDELLKEQKLQISGCVDECLIEVGKMLGAKQIVLGSVGRIGGLFTISAKLVDAESGKMIRTADYDTEISLSQLFKDGLSQIAVSLSNETDLNQQLKKTNTLTQSYKLPYKSALENYNAGLTNLNIDNLVDAEYFFNQTIKIDPSYAPAISGLADVMIKYNDPIEANKFLIQAVNIDEDFRGQFDILYKQFPDIDWSLVDPPPKKWWSKDGQKPKVEFIKYDDPPVAMSPIKPDPEFEISVNYDGIIIQTYINDEGFVTKTIILVGSPNSELNQEAMRSIRMTRFKPAKLRRKSLGFWRRKSIGVWVSIPFNFPNGVPIK